MGKVLLTASFAGIPRVMRLARALAEEGHAVHVIEWDRSGTLPPTELREGVLFLRYRKKSGFGLRSSFSMIRWLIFQFLHVIRFDYDIIQPRNLDSLVPVLLALWISRKRSRTSVVYDMSDFYAESYLPIPIIRLFVASLERFLVDKVDALLLVSPKQMLQLLKRPAPPIVMVYNFPDEAVQSTGEVEYDLYYAGTLGRDRCWELIQIIALASLAKLRLAIAGFGECEDFVKDISEKLENVIFLGRLGRKELLRKASRSRAIVSVHHPRSSQNYRIALPNKFLDAIKLRKPVIVARGTYIADIVRRYGIGVAIELGDLKSAVGEVLKAVSSEFPEEGFTSLESLFSWNESKKRYLSLISGLLGRSKKDIPVKP